MSADETVGRRRPARRRASGASVLLRQIPGDSTVHRLWAGTKLVVVAALAVTVSAQPSWPVLGVTAAMLVVAARLAGVGRTALPHPPRLFWLLMAAGAVFTLASGGSPELAFGGVHVGFGDLVLFLRFTVLGAVLLGASALVAWTTPLGEVAPALARLWSPLRRLRLPVDEWAVTVALCIRSLPLLFEELRVLLAARRLRAAPVGRRDLDSRLDELIDIMTTALAASLRRAGEMGEAITARGGTGQLSASVAGPHGRDAVAIGIVAAVVCAGVGLSLL